jgi:hypothetical protein
MKLSRYLRQRAESFLIDDDAGTLICAVYFTDSPGRRNSTERMDEATAREMAKRIARLVSES